MELDSSTIVYIVAVIIYFLYSMFFRKKSPEDGLPQDGGEEDVSPKQTVSFDDLLKEIRREQGERERDLEREEPQEKEPHVPEPAPSKYFTYEDTEKFPSYDTIHQESNKSPYKDYERQPMVKLDDQVDIESSEKILGEVEDVAEEYAGSNKYGEMLKNPQTVRDAIVLSEILNRKHFSV